MKADELRKMYLGFFAERGHKVISGSSLVPENDPTVLFTTAGMHSLVPYLLGESHPEGKRLANCQKCIRTGDIEEVGDGSHLTFFEMLGNWSLGDYFKEEAIAWSYEFLTSSSYLGFSPDQLSVSVFGGNNEVPRDEESIAIWQKLGVKEGHIFALPEEDNWWGLPGDRGPCGPDTEMFIDTGTDSCGPECRPGCSCGKYFEIWNDVFMQYEKKPGGSLGELKQHNVDTGMGVERTIAMLQGRNTVYETELFSPVMQIIESMSDGRSSSDGAAVLATRVIADHVRSAVFVLGDELGIVPGNLGQGYVLRRLIRNAVRQARKIGLAIEFTQPIAERIIDIYGPTYPELVKNKEHVVRELLGEEKRFEKTLSRGLHELDKVLGKLKEHGQLQVSGRVAFRLYDTYGFPVELTEEICAEKDLTIDRKGYDEAFKKHKELARQASGKSFKGGLADNSETTTRLHTATHLLHKSLQAVLGDHVRQKGSNITPERLRFDFVQPAKLTAEEKQAVEDLVNDVIRKDLPVTMEVMTMEEAVAKGAMALFAGKYGEQVKVYSIGDFSKEVCGGPHVKNLRELGKFKITKEEASSAGVRRIRAVLISDEVNN